MVNVHDLSPEILAIILSYLPPKSILNASETCRRWREISLWCDMLWKRLCKDHFDVNLEVKGPFYSYFIIYQNLYKLDVICKNLAYRQYVPEFVYHWCLLYVKMSGKWNFVSKYWISLSKSRFKKTWDLSNDELMEAISERKYLSYSERDCVKAIFNKHNSRVEFQEAVLKHCIRSQKRISNQFIESAACQRKKDFYRFYSSNSSYGSILVKTETVSCYDNEKPEPQKIGNDYIQGLLHKSGLGQLECYLKFVKHLRRQYEDSPHYYKHINEIALSVYEELSTTATKRLVTTREFLTCSQDYFDRVQEVWEWQSVKGELHQNQYRNSTLVEKHQAFKDFIQHGKHKDLKTLMNHFEGLEKLKKWLANNIWIKPLLSSVHLRILEGEGDTMFLASTSNLELKEKVKLYLISGHRDDLTGVIWQLWKLANEFVKDKALLVKDLKKSLLSDGF